MSDAFDDDDLALRRALQALKQPTSPRSDFPDRVVDELRVSHLVRSSRRSSIAWKVAASALIFVSGVGAGLLLDTQRSTDSADNLLHGANVIVDSARPSRALRDSLANGVVRLPNVRKPTAASVTLSGQPSLSLSSANLPSAGRTEVWY